MSLQSLRCRRNLCSSGCSPCHPDIWETSILCWRKGKLKWHHSRGIGRLLVPKCAFDCVDSTRISREILCSGEHQSYYNMKWRDWFSIFIARRKSRGIRVYFLQRQCLGYGDYRWVRPSIFIRILLKWVDSMLYTRVPKWEELKFSEQELYHFDKEIYNKSARKGGKTLYFARSGAAGDTWVPLIEKAYAKLHGNYSHLFGGQECDAIEDLTGWVLDGIIGLSVSKLTTSAR